MNYEFIKNVYENIPKKLKFAMAPIFQGLILHNATYKKTVAEIRDYSKRSKREQEDITWKKLQRVVRYAYQHSEYYKELFDSIGFDPSKDFSKEDYKKVPCINKNIAVEQGTRVMSDEKIPSYEAHTSGSSSGKVFRVVLDKDSIYKERAFVNTYLEKFGYNPKKSRTVSFWGHNKDSDFYYSPMKNEIVISPFRLFKEEEFEAVWEDIVAFKPEVMAGYPSAIQIFAQLANKYKKTLKLKIVEFYAENYTVEIKEYVEKTFSCKAVATYGHTERAIFGELYENGYQFNGLYGYTELVPIENDAEHQLYQIICTGFNSKKMPLIRYATDDAVYFDENGNMFVQGHTTSEARVIGKNGARIYKGTLSPHVQQFEKVKLYQYVQYEEGKVFLDLVLDQPLTDDDMKTLNAYYERKCEGVLEIEIRIVDEIRLNKRGKYSWLISYLK